jgi:hypothetical protein
VGRLSVALVVEVILDSRYCRISSTCRGTEVHGLIVKQTMHVVIPLLVVFWPRRWIVHAAAVSIGFKSWLDSFCLHY